MNRGSALSEADAAAAAKAHRVPASSASERSEWQVVTFRNLLPRSDVCVVSLPLERHSGGGGGGEGGTRRPSSSSSSSPSAKERIMHFVIGGQTKESNKSDIVESIEWQCRSSWKMASLTVPRIGCGAALLRGVIYTVGGLSNDSTVLASVEKYSFFHEEKKWELLPKFSNLKIGRWGHAVVSMPRKNAIFAIGGRNGSWEELSSVEVAQQNPAGDLHWNRLPYGMRQKRFGAAAVPIGDAAFMTMGGYDGSKWTKTAVMYEVDGDDIRDGVWTELPDMPRTVVFAKATVADIRGAPYVFVAGATDDGESLLQVYSVQQQIWAIMDTDGGEEGCSLTVEGDNLLCIGGDTNQVRYLNLEEESHKGTLAVLSGGGTGAAIVEVPATLVEFSDEKQASHETRTPPPPPPHSDPPRPDPAPTPAAVPRRAPPPTPPPPPPAPVPPPAPAPARRVENLECVVDGEMARYSGELNAAGQRHGKGLLIWPDQNGSFYPKALSKNSYYEGEFEDDYRAGEGIFYVHEEGRLYQGTFYRGVLFGEGTLTDVNRGLEYKGTFRKGMSSGEGRCTYHSTGRVFEGTWKRGRPISGRLIEADGRVSQEGNGPWSIDLAVDLSRAGPAQNNGAGPLQAGTPGPYPAHQQGHVSNTKGISSAALRSDVLTPPISHKNPVPQGLASAVGANNLDPTQPPPPPPPPQGSPPTSQQNNFGGGGQRMTPPYVEKLECMVEGELAQYTGPLNAEGQRHGRGFMVWADEEGNFYATAEKRNTYYEGEFFEDSRSGSGLMFVKDENRTYRGTFDRGVLTGEGSLDDGRRGLFYEGFFKKGTPHGEGKCVYGTTNRIFIGRWRKGQPIAGKLYNNQGQMLQQGNSGWGVELAVD